MKEGSCVTTAECGQKEARRFGNGHDQTEPVLLKRPAGEHWQPWIYGSNMPACKSSTVSQTSSSKDGVLGFTPLKNQGWISTQHS